MLAMRARPYVPAEVSPVSGEDWDISTAVFSRSFSVDSKTTSPFGLEFSDDGTKMYVSHVSLKLIHQYALSSAWDISTAAYLKSGSPGGFADSIRGFCIANNGQTLFVADTVGDGIVQFLLPTPWDIGNLAFVTSISTAAVESSVTDVAVSPDGTRLFIVGGNGREVNSYTLGTAWDLTTATHDTFVLSVSDKDLSPNGIAFSPDGARLFIVGSSSDIVIRYDLQTPWLLASASYTSQFSVASEDQIPTGIAFKPDGSMMFIAGDSYNTVYQYNLA
jgi:sugar lactone lactonase YvrE